MATRDLNGVQLHYTEQGSGRPVLLVHGFPLDVRMWDAQVPALAAAGWRVIAPDLRGFGGSLSETPFTLESLADDVHALAAGVGAIPFVFVGLSMGGYVALAYARKYPADLRALVLVDTKAEADTAEGKQGRAKMIELARKEGSKAVADQMMPKMLAKDAADQRPQTAQALRRIMEACPPKTIEHALAAMRDRPDRSGELAQIKVPTLVIVGESDAITPPAVAESMVSKLPGAQLVVIKGAGHMSPMEQPEQVNRAIKSFLDRQA
jgi:pimeloyl-ACP methyl ester carboxylesterase